MVQQACGTISFDDCFIFILVPQVEYTSQLSHLQGTTNFHKENRLSGLALLTRQECWARLPRADKTIL